MDGAAAAIDRAEFAGKRITLASVKRGVSEAVADMRERIDRIQRDRRATNSAKVAAEIEKRDVDTIFKGAEKIHNDIDKWTRATIKRLEKSYGIKANDSSFRRAFDNKAQRKARGYIDEVLQRRATAYGKVNDAFERALERQAVREADRNGTTVDKARETIKERLLYKQESTTLTRAIDAAVAISDRIEKFAADRRARAEAKNMDARYQAEAHAKHEAVVAPGPSTEPARPEPVRNGPIRADRGPDAPEPTAADSAYWRRNEHNIDPAKHRTESYFLDASLKGVDAKSAVIYGKGDGFDVEAAVERRKREREAAREKSIAPASREQAPAPRAKKQTRRITPALK